MNKMMNPELEVVRFGAEDVIATSMYYVQDENGIGTYFQYTNHEDGWYFEEQNGVSVNPFNFTPQAGFWYRYDESTGMWSEFAPPYQYGGGPEDGGSSRGSYTPSTN